MTDPRDKTLEELMRASNSLRDPARIPRILAKLGQVWPRYPQWRLSQLIVNFSDDADPFYVEDDVLEARLDDTQRYLSGEESA